MLGFVFGSTDDGVIGNRGSLFGYGDFDDNIVGIEVFVVERFKFDAYLEFIVSHLKVVGHNFKGQINILCNPITH